jgi:hypothetical protein
MLYASGKNFWEVAMIKRWAVGCLWGVLLLAGCVTDGGISSEITPLPTLTMLPPDATSPLPTQAMFPTQTTAPTDLITPTASRRLDHFQIGNYQPLLAFTSKTSWELADNKIGDMFSLYPLAHPGHPGYEAPQYFADRISSHGLKWMRLCLDWFDGSELGEDGVYSTFEVHPEQDAAVDALLERGVGVNLALVYWDETLGDQVMPSRFADEKDVERYLDYVRFVVSHFQGRVAYYSLLNEPNIGKGSQQYVDPQDYAALVRRVIPIIREIDPAAKIIIGEVTPLIWPEAIRYMEALLETDVLPLADGLSWHSAGWSSPEYMAEEYAAYQNYIPEMITQAQENGFQGDFWATENHWRTAESAHPEEYHGYSGVTAAKYLARGIIWHRGQGFRVGLAENLEHVHKQPVIENISTLLADAEPVTITINVEPEVENLHVFSFEDGEGNLLIAVWRDGVAQEADAGLPFNLIIQRSGFVSFQGVDVMLGITQDLVFSEEQGGRTILPEVLIRDYPLVIQAQP